MEAVGVSKAILSISSPGTHLSVGDNKSARLLARRCNEFGAELKRHHPKKFGFWASIPLPDVEGCLEEIPLALDQLNADGFVILTNFHDMYPGDTSLDKVFALLDERKATVFMHPTSPCFCREGLEPQIYNPLPKYPAPMLEFEFDASRALTNMLLSGLLSRYLHLDFIITHCGGVFPLIERVAGISAMVSPDHALSAEKIGALLRDRFWFDLAGMPFFDTILGLLRVVGSKKLLYGSDYRYTELGLWRNWRELLTRTHRLYWRRLRTETPLCRATDRRCLSLVQGHGRIEEICVAEFSSWSNRLLRL